MTDEAACTTRVMWWFGAVSVAVSAGAAVQLLVGAPGTAAPVGYGVGAVAWSGPAVWIHLAVGLAVVGAGAHA